MARTLTANAQTEAAKKSGPARPVYILEVAFESGTAFWAGEDLSSPVTAEGRILQWGELSLSATPGQAGGVGEMKITVHDVDHFIKQEAESQPGFQNVDATLYLWFEGTTWATDRIVLFAGVLTAPCEWNEATATYQLTMKGREHKHNPDIGIVASVTVFPEIDCKSCENELLPIVYGNPCYRVPACVIDRPGEATLAETLYAVPPAGSLRINVSAGDAGFTVGAPTTLRVGTAGQYELIEGSFADSADDTFSISSRAAILTGGMIPGFYGTGGVLYITIPQTDLSSLDSLIGYPLLLREQDGTWKTTTVSHWTVLGGTVAIAAKGDFDVVTGSAYQILATPGIVPVWPVGTPVSEVAQQATSGAGAGERLYFVNFLPSEEVVRVEAPGKLQMPGGQAVDAWLEINPAHYSVDLNNTDFNDQLGRDPGDPGCTTITIGFDPATLGLDSETMFVTLRGITDDGTESGSALENPAEVIQDLLTNPFLGNVPAARIDTSAFSAAAAQLVTKFSFALLDEKRSVNDLCGDLAHQANCVFFWDQGKATLKYLKPTISAGDSVYTITNANRRHRSLKISEIDIKQAVTELHGVFRRAVPADESRIVRGSVADRADTSGNASSAGGNAAVTDFGLHRDEIEFWAYQFPTSVAKSTEDWLAFHLGTNRLVTVDLFLDAIKLQPADVIILDIDDGDGNAIFDSVPARIRSLRQTLGAAKGSVMPIIQAICEVQLYDYGIVRLSPNDDDCAGQKAKAAGRVRSRKLYLRSTGAQRSLYVVMPEIKILTDGDATAPVGESSDAFDPPNPPPIVIGPPPAPIPPPSPGPIPPPIDSGSGPPQYDTSASAIWSDVSLGSTSIATSGGGSGGSSSGGGSGGSSGGTSGGSGGGGSSDGSSGTGPSSGEDLANCGCCDGQLGKFLTVTLENVASCECADGVQITVEDNTEGCTWDGSVAEVGSCGLNGTIQVVCSGDVWSINGSGDCFAFGPIAADSQSCSPLVVVWNEVSICCGSVKITLTE